MDLLFKTGESKSKNEWKWFRIVLHTKVIQKIVGDNMSISLVINEDQARN